MRGVGLLLGLLSGAAQAQAAHAQGPGAHQTCVDVQIGSAPYYSCLNEDLARLVPGHRASSADAPVTALLPAPAAGTYNQAALREHLGSNYGFAAVPPPLPPPVFPPPFSGRH
jgi:hypothetical protein